MSGPKELAKARALPERVKQALTRTQSEDGPDHTNLTDADASPLKSRHGFIAGYNAPRRVGAKLEEAAGGEQTGGMFITGAGLAPSGDDHTQLTPMIEEAAANTGADGATGAETVTLADAGYHSGPNLEQAAQEGLRVLTPATNDPKRRNPYDKSHFTYRAETDAYRCLRVKRSASARWCAAGGSLRCAAIGREPRYASHVPPSECARRTDEAARWKPALMNSCSVDTGR